MTSKSGATYLNSEPPKRTLRSLDAEIFVHKGAQYIYLGAHFKESGFAMGEYAIPVMDLKPFTMDMYFLRVPREYKISGSCIEMADFGCRKLKTIMHHQASDQPLFTCEFEIGFVRELHWLTGRHHCEPQDLPVVISNENS